MEEAWGVIKELSADERERLLAEDREKTRRDKAAYYETGFVEGRAEGIATGVEKGRAEGHAEGISEGRLEERRAMIVKMLSHGLSPEQISSFTGIALDELKSVSKHALP